MASILQDLGFLQFFLPVFTFLFIFVLVYAVLDKFKLMGENKWLKLIASFSVALLFLFSNDTLRFVEFITPWFVVLVVLALFILSLFMFMGLKEGDVEKVVKDPIVYWTVLVIIIILLIVAVGNVFSFVSPYQGGDPTPPTEGLNAIVHPRTLGALFLLVIAAFAVKFISTGFGDKK
ncbi:MAG: hypothetical protein AABW56_02185 [Nanoarchaeota archaeon]